MYLGDRGVCIGILHSERVRCFQLGEDIRTFVLVEGWIDSMDRGGGSPRFHCC